MALPASLETRVVKGHIDKGNGEPEVGKVTFKRTVVLESPSDQLFLTPMTYPAELDSNGEFSITLPVADDPQWTPQLWAYEIEIQVSAWNHRFNYTLLTGDGSPIDLIAIMQPPTGPPFEPVSGYVRVLSVGQVGGPAGPLDPDGKIPVEQIPGGVGGGEGTVTSVNGELPDETGNVLLDAAAVGAAPSAHGHPISAVTGLSGELDALGSAIGTKADAAAVTNALAGKSNTGHGHAVADVTGLQTALDGKQPSGSYAPATHSHAWGDVTGKPTTFTPSTHSHEIAQVNGLQTALDGKQAAGSYAAASHTHSTSQVTGLDAALSAKAPLASPTFTGTVSGITKGMVGLGSVSNIPPADMPVSTAQQAALDAKWDILVLGPSDPIPTSPAPRANKTLIFRTA